MKKDRSCWWCFPTVALLLVVLAGMILPPVQAQVLYGALVGTVRDPSGAVLPGASVVITNAETKATRETVTDAAGAYRFSTLQPGTYTVVVQVTGFRTFTRADVPVTLNSSARVDALLGVGDLQENVTVSAEYTLSLHDALPIYRKSVV